MNYIQGNKFKALTALHYAPARIYTGGDDDGINNIPFSDYRFLRNTVDFNELKEDELIYTHTFYARQLFKKLEKLYPMQFKVVTHNADTPADFPPPDNVFWFTTNVAIRYNGPTLGFGSNMTSIPIGIENDIWLKDKTRIMELKLQNPKKYRSLVYCNHNIQTNPKKRQKPYEVLRGVNWATIHIGSNGQGFENYIDNVYNHPFVVCPEGNGIDTHRIWECLYMNTIPIVLKNINNSFYTDLPILFLNDWEEMNEKFLYDSFMEMSYKEWNMDKLDFNYWKDEILAS